jgi:hypothetical protein
VTGKISNGGMNQDGSLFFDQSGNIGFTYTLSQTTSIPTVINGEKVNVSSTRSIGGIGLNSNGDITGNVNLGKVLNFKNDVFLGFDQTGLTSLGGNIGSLGGNAIGASVSLKSGALSFGTFIPIAGVPIPIGLGQGSRGDFAITFPGGSIKLCSLGIGKCESRPDVPTVPKTDADGNVDFSAVQCQHSYKQL